MIPLQLRLHDVVVGAVTVHDHLPVLGLALRVEACHHSCDRVAVIGMAHGDRARGTRQLEAVGIHRQLRVHVALRHYLRQLADRARLQGGEGGDSVHAAARIHRTTGCHFHVVIVRRAHSVVAEEHEDVRGGGVLAHQVLDHIDREGLIEGRICLLQTNVHEVKSRSNTISNKTVGSVWERRRLKRRVRTDGRCHGTLIHRRTT